MRTCAHRSYQHTAVVTCLGRFPIDMLRYDRCFPDSERDAGNIQQSLENPDATTMRVKVTKVGWHKDFKDAFTEGRWKSFGCSIEENAD